MKLICPKFLTKEYENLLPYIVKMKIDIQGVARDPEESFGEKLIRYKKFLPGIICKTKQILTAHFDKNFSLKFLGKIVSLALVGLLVALLVCADIEWVENEYTGWNPQTRWNNVSECFASGSF